MVDHIVNRRLLIDKLKEELVGPAPLGDEIDCSKEVALPAEEKSSLFNKSWVQKGSKEEILVVESPTRRYGIGVLYPIDANTTAVPLEEEGATSVESGLSEDGVEGEESDHQIFRGSVQKDLEKIEERASSGTKNDELDDLGIGSANRLFPSSMGLSFLGNFADDAVLIITFKGAYYIPISAKAGSYEKPGGWWLRRPIEITESISAVDILNQERLTLDRNIDTENNKQIKLEINIISRKNVDSKTSLLTVSVINRSEGAHEKNEFSLFQSYFSAEILAGENFDKIMPYPERDPSSLTEEEEKSIRLLYWETKTFAIGHGCSADWKIGSTADVVRKVEAISLPEVSIPNITPEIEREDGSRIEVPMAPLAGLVDGDDGMAAIEEVLNQYENWISDREKEISGLPDETCVEAANRHLDQWRNCLERIKNGLEFIKTDVTAAEAFRLANYAILLQQLRFQSKPRSVTYLSNHRLEFGGLKADREVLLDKTDRGKWRPFQIAFLLMAAESAANGNSSDRDLVDLIWFPTGGGKTEAYLGLAAFTIFTRRLASPDDSGTHVLMRYTLRLLTTQQFLRGAALVCAMEDIRRKYSDNGLGSSPLTIGVWLGSEITPNKKKVAKTSLSKLKKYGRQNDNMFLLTRCPWCSAPMGPVRYAKKAPAKAPKVLGYELSGDSISYKCPDEKCEFHDRLPIYSVDEDIYEHRPEIVIGTVDKFARLAWEPSARKMFGLDDSGARVCSPPGLIIQDELHLISGPLGSMVGLYEVLVEELCTDRREEKQILPKIVTSTATIRRYEEQILALYARDRTSLFPAPGLEAGDSFFARYAKDKNGLLPGKIFLGVHGSGLGSVQTAQVRVFTSLLQMPVALDTEERDPWWTLLIFFNSLRELGTTVSLFQSDIPDRLEILKNRFGLDYKELRSLWKIKELTGRIPNHEIPQAIDQLSESTSDTKYPIDACLASNIIEVGIDIDRLSLMSIVGQPKTTSQYIQVSGRVGRRWWERPGLVVTILSPSKPRDRSHYEKFRNYHEQLYAQVEPTSVTPFSAPVIDRALHAVMAAFVRQCGDKAQAASPSPYPETLVNHMIDLLKARLDKIDPVEASNMTKVFQQRISEWKKWNRLFWDGKIQSKSPDFPQLRVAGAYAQPIFRNRSWATPNSMRNVDAQCQTDIRPPLEYDTQKEKDDE